MSSDQKQSKFRRGLISTRPDLDYLRGRLDADSLLDELGIDTSHRLGKWIMCHCPDWLGNHMNGDANPSFGFDPEDLKYNCFVCGPGDALELVEVMTGQNTKEALQTLERHSDLNPLSPDDLVEKVQKIMHPEVKSTVTPDYPESSIFPFRKIHPYLYERGLTREVIVDMQVGFDDAHCGITFPHSFMGKLVGWQTRHLAQDDQGNYICDFCQEDQHSDNRAMMKTSKIGKYINTRNFPKLNTLYGYDRFRQKMVGDYVIVVESPFTALWLMSHGFDNVVATFGSFSREQGMLLLPVPKLYFWPDNDGAGYENAKRCIASNRQYNSIYIVPAVPGAKSDAANLSSHDEVEAYLNAAYPASLFPMKSPGQLYVYGN